MMSEKDRYEAGKHIEAFYDRTLLNLQFMIDAAQQADSNMSKALGIPPSGKTFTESLVTNLFGFALQVAFPGWTIFSKTLRGTVPGADQSGPAQVLAGIVSAGLEISGRGYHGGNSEVAKAQSRMEAINRIIAGLAGAKSSAQLGREAADRDLTEKAFVNKTNFTFAQIRAAIGELPPIIEDFEYLIYCFEYQLWERYVRDHVTLKLSLNTKRRIVSWDTSGIGKTTAAYIFSRFTKSIPTAPPSLTVTGLRLRVTLPGWRPIRTYTDLAAVWAADASIEDVSIAGNYITGELISRELEEAIKWTSAKTPSVLLGSGFNAPKLANR